MTKYKIISSSRQGILFKPINAYPHNRTAKGDSNYFDNHWVSLRDVPTYTHIWGIVVPFIPHKSIWQVFVITRAFHIRISFVFQRLPWAAIWDHVYYSKSVLPRRYKQTCLYFSWSIIWFLCLVYQKSYCLFFFTPLHYMFI